MRGFKAAVLLVGLALVTAACNPVGVAEDWAGQAQEQGWRAEYRVVFHQQDQDLEFLVCEEHGNGVLLMDIAGPGGHLELKFDAQGLNLVLDRGELEWRQSVHGPPHYSLLIIARQLLAGEPTARDGWVEAGLYRLKFNGKAPGEITCGEDWTLTVISFQWH